MECLNLKEYFAELDDTELCFSDSEEESVDQVPSDEACAPKKRSCVDMVARTVVEGQSGLFKKLPFDIVSLILKTVPLEALGQCTLLSRWWSERLVVQDANLWRLHYVNRFGPAHEPVYEWRTFYKV